MGIRNGTFQRVNDLIFGKIQTIADPFINNVQSQKSLKLSIQKYYNFTRILSELLHKNNVLPWIIFSRNQRKFIYNFNSIVTNIKSTNAKQNVTALEKSHFTNINHEECVKNQDEIQKYINSDRLKRAEYVLSNRTDRILLIFECTDLHNSYAMLRTAEIFGVQNVWIIKPIEYRNIDICNRISKSCQQWLPIKFFSSPNECIKELKQSKKHKHRKVWVMDVGKNSKELTAENILSSSSKQEYFAIVMGKESSGPSNEFLNVCDQSIFLSQYGFTESFNVSVACSVMLTNMFLIYPNMRGDMDESDRKKIRLQWYNQLIRDDGIQKKLQKYLGSNGKIDQIDDIRVNDNNSASHKSSKHKINHALRDKIKSERNQHLI